MLKEQLFISSTLESFLLDSSVSAFFGKDLSRKSVFADEMDQNSPKPAHIRENADEIEP